VTAGVQYTLSETGPTGYSASDFSCSVDGGNPVSENTITLDFGEEAVCTITNNDVAPQLTVIKHVINDSGGTAVASDFTLDSGGINDTPDNFPGAESPGTVVTLDAGSYNVNESGPSGYTASFSADCSGSIDVGQSKTCTVTNNDQAAKLIVIKHVVNDNGGTAAAADFSLDSGGANDTPDNFAGAESPGTEVTLNAGSYSVTETGPTGYSASYSADCSGTIANGQTKTCTVTNDDISPQLTVIKHVINDNGGSAVAASFTMNVTGTNVSTPSFPGAESPGTTVTLNAGAYSVDENAFSGYTKSIGADCSGNIAVGVTKTCTITNDDQQAYVTVVKVVNNNYGGTASPNNFSLTLDGSAVSSGVAVAVNPGNHTAAENLLSGYTFDGFSLDCNSGGVVTVALGESKTCRLTNSDIQPRLTLIKYVTNNNGGTLGVSDFPLFISGTPTTSGTSVGLVAGNYTASETSQYGYTPGPWGGNCASNGTVTLNIGDNKVCTITNDDQPGTIVIVKNAKPESGSFSFDTTGSTSGPGTSWPASFGLSGDPAGGANTRSFTVDRGNYTAAESTQLGWLLTGIGGSADPTTPYACVVTGSGGSSGSGDLNTATVTMDVRNGDTVNCTFENTGSGATRTQGFWQTHPQLADIAWNGGDAFGHSFPGVVNTAGIGDTTMCTRSLTIDGFAPAADGNSELLGGFWSSVSKTTSNKKRSALDQGRMQLLQQLLAAELNASAFGSVPSGGSGKFAVWEDALCGINQTAISNAQSQAAAFNSQGDSSTFTPGTSADSKNARLWANYVFWNIVKP